MNVHGNLDYLRGSCEDLPFVFYANNVTTYR